VKWAAAGSRTKCGSAASGGVRRRSVALGGVRASDTPLATCLGIAPPRLPIKSFQRCGSNTQQHTALYSGSTAFSALKFRLITELQLLL